MSSPATVISRIEGGEEERRGEEKEKDKDIRIRIILSTPGILLALQTNLPCNQSWDLKLAEDGRSEMVPGQGRAISTYVVIADSMAPIWPCLEQTSRGPAVEDATVSTTGMASAGTRALSKALLLLSCVGCPCSWIPHTCSCPLYHVR
jgi:hypothetical protein